MTPLAAPAPPVPASAQSTSILLAVTSREFSMFLGQEEPAIPGTHFTTVDTEDLAISKWCDILDRTRPEILVSCWATPRLPLDWLKQKDCPLRYVCHLTGAVRQLVPREFIESRGFVTNWGSCAAPQVAEHALLLVLSALRDSSRWKVFRPTTKLLTTQTLFGKRVGVHGFGKIARRFIELLKPFGTKVSVYAHGVPHELIRAHNAVPSPSLLELARNSEVLVDCEALTEESRGSVSREVLAALPDDSVFVNVGRGKVVDEPALIEEARSGRIRVGLDVVAVEPLPPDSPLTALTNVIYSPHIAGPTGDTLRNCGYHATANIQRYLNGEPLEAQISLEIYDRST